MGVFANSAAFEHPTSRLRALGTDLSPDRAIVDQHGNVVARARTGGMASPSRFELKRRSTVYRFGGHGMSPRHVAQGAWWIERSEFEKLVNFANAQEIFIGLAMRVLCLVPPEWSDASVLVRARVARDLLAWRGLANSVVTPAKTGPLGTVKMPHQNDISARRIHQLFIPGLDEPGLVDPPMSIEHAFHLDPREGTRGFLYL
ncbi:hypothetical protein [Ramlibacter aurantiacus]|uniref:hypothetical protein n=1 Tax=Ramlibacter aurantiacus TaxID=2801330 RepID=UPI001F1B5C01|nr:hypothetical protein [Ramlibacter aurantiacus]